MVKPLVCLHFLINRCWLLAIVAGVASCRAQIDVKTAKGPEAPAETPIVNPELPAPEVTVPDPTPKTGSTKPIREILPAATDNIWQTRSFVKIQLAEDLAVAPVTSLVLSNLTTSLELDHTSLYVDTCGSFKCIFIPASFVLEGNPFFAYGINELHLISQGTAEDLRMPHRLIIRDFKVFGTVNHVPSATESSSMSVLRPIGTSLISIAPASNGVSPKSYFTGHWQEQVERP